jgi:hypothetical protein
MSGFALQPGGQAALDKLPRVTTLAGMTSLINSLSASATSPNAVLYSGSLSDGIYNYEATTSMVTERFIPQVNGSDAKIAEIDGPAGQFEVAAISINKDGEHRFFYRDEHAHFYFYAERPIKPVAQWIVTGASDEAGSAPFISTPENEVGFRANIEHFFKTRRSSNPTKFGDESTAQVPVSFSWRITR